MPGPNQNCPTHSIALVGAWRCSAAPPRCNPPSKSRATWFSFPTGVSAILLELSHHFPICPIRWHKLVIVMPLTLKRGRDILIIVKKSQLSRVAGLSASAAFLLPDSPHLGLLRADCRENVFLYVFLAAGKMLLAGKRILVRFSTTAHDRRRAPALCLFHFRR